jgi:hypothetical protein
LIEDELQEFRDRAAASSLTVAKDRVLLQVNNLAASAPRCGQNTSYERPKWLT